jgi:hypothetical protein
MRHIPAKEFAADPTQVSKVAVGSGEPHVIVKDSGEPTGGIGRDQNIKMPPNDEDELRNIAPEALQEYDTETAEVRLWTR